MDTSNARSSDLVHVHGGFLASYLFLKKKGGHSKAANYPVCNRRRGYP